MANLIVIAIISCVVILIYSTFKKACGGRVRRF